MQALILAAGMGKRLKKLTNDIPKCMIKVNGVPLIERMLKQLDKLKLNKIVIVVGYKSQILMNFVQSLNIKTEIKFVTNKDYSKTNNIYSLYIARNYLKEDDTLLLESDLIFEDSILKTILKNQTKNLVLVSKYESWMNGTVVTLGENDNISRFITQSDFNFNYKNQYYKTVNVYKFSKDFSTNKYIPFLEAYCKALGGMEYYEQVLKIIMHLKDNNMKALRLENEKWYEIDDIQDLDIAQSLFEKKEKSYDIIQKRYGGFWRYPKLKDFCYLMNPYFPPQRLINEIKSNFEELISAYPSNIEISNLLFSKIYNIEKECISAANGASELINILSNTIQGNWGIIQPSFDEYKNRKKEVIAYVPKNKNFEYSACDIISFFDKQKITTLVLINPDNPSGNYIPHQDVIRLLKWCERKNIKLILDESFVDFSNKEESPSLIKGDILEKYKNLIIIKSISKSHSMAGLRLGVIASGDKDLIKTIKQKMPIWNINSFAEFYLQIFEKYKDDYKNSLEKFYITRECFIKQIKKIPYLRVIPTQANYIMCEVLKPYTSKEIANILFQNNILIKDLSSKDTLKGKNYIRIAIKNQDENLSLIRVLSELV